MLVTGLLIEAETRSVREVRFENTIAGACSVLRCNTLQGEISLELGTPALILRVPAILTPAVEFPSFTLGTMTISAGKCLIVGEPTEDGLSPLELSAADVGMIIDWDGTG